MGNLTPLHLQFAGAAQPKCVKISKQKAWSNNYDQLTIVILKLNQPKKFLSTTILPHHHATAFSQNNSEMIGTIVFKFNMLLHDTNDTDLDRKSVV